MCGELLLDSTYISLASCLLTATIDDVLSFIGMALRVLNLVNHDSDDSEDQTEGSQDRESDHNSLDLLSNDTDVVSLFDELFIISLEILGVVVKRERLFVLNVLLEVREWVSIGVVLAISSTVFAICVVHPHVDGRFLLDLISEASIRLNLQEVIASSRCLIVLDTVNGNVGPIVITGCKSRALVAASGFLE